MERLNRLIKEAIVVIVAALVVTVAAGAAFTWYAHSHSAATAKKTIMPELSVGDPVKVNGSLLSGGSMAILLITSPICRYCLASKQFHKTLSTEAAANHVPLYIAVPSKKTSELYLKTAEITGDQKSWSDLGFRITGTPTLILIDSTGAARAILVGQLPPASEMEVLKIVQDPSQIKAAGFTDGRMRLSVAQYTDFRKSQKTVLIDVHEREEYKILHRDGAINIPIIELPIRASFELDRSSLVVVDCSQYSTAKCDAIMKTVSRLGFKSVVLSEGVLVNSCKVSRAID